MGKRGPGKTPKKIAELRGNPGKRPLNHDEPVGKIGVPGPPDWLSDSAKAAYREVVDAAMPGLIQATDVHLLIAYADSVAVYVEACKQLAKEGWTEDTRGGSKKNAWVTIRREALLDMKGLATQFGFSPSSRTAIQVEKGKGEDVESAAFLRLVDGTNSRTG